MKREKSHKDDLRIGERQPYFFIRSNLGVQKAVHDLLMEGKRIPYMFRNYGQYAEREIYESDMRIGSGLANGSKSFQNMKDPSPEDIINLNHY